MKFFTRKMAKDPTQADELKIRLIKQQITANETQKILGQITDNEYQANIARCDAALKELEAKYGLSDQQ